jgi:hypothetical protein
MDAPVSLVDLARLRQPLASAKIAVSITARHRTTIPVRRGHESFETGFMNDPWQNGLTIR